DKPGRWGWKFRLPRGRWCGPLARCQRRSGRAAAARDLDMIRWAAYVPEHIAELLRKVSRVTLDATLPSAGQDDALPDSGVAGEARCRSTRAPRRGRPPGGV